MKMPPDEDFGITVHSDVDTWKRLPEATIGAGQHLPNWARVIATHLPRTAAAMLELDYAHRTKSPLDPILRAKMRWVISRSNQCDTAMAAALADLERAGADEATRNRLTGNPADWSTADQEPLEFARQLTVSAHQIPDELFENLRNRFGDKQVAAMVLLAAYGNFFDRIVLGLRLPIEPTGSPPLSEIKFAEGAFQIAPRIPPQLTSTTAPAAGMTVVDIAEGWERLTHDELSARLEQQRMRKPRLPIPLWEDFAQNLPFAMRAKPTRIVWNLVCSGYVPELAVPWSIATRTMWDESRSDRIFEESLFWIQTRAVECNYCMGHCEMLLQVAGLNQTAVTERTHRLGSADWSMFPPEEQRTYAFAQKLTTSPWELNLADYQSLVTDYGPAKAIAIFWWLCRGLYMTRVSDGFQLPLERENVFE